MKYYLLALTISSIPALATFYFLRAPKGTPKRGQKRTLIALLGSMIFPFLALNWAYNAIHYPPHYRLTDDKTETNHTYYQPNQPSSDEVKAGLRALKLWKTASKQERNKLADDLVLSKVLIGKTQKEIVDYMGLPDAFGAIHDVGPHIRRTGYYAADGESQCDLIIELNDDGKVSETHLEVNY